jgi:hypothetical protein
VKGFGCRPDHGGGAGYAGRRRKASRGGNRGPASATVEVAVGLWGFEAGADVGEAELAADARAGLLRPGAGHGASGPFPHPR